MVTLAPEHCAREGFIDPTDAIRKKRSKIFFMLQGFKLKNTNLLLCSSIYDESFHPLRAGFIDWTGRYSVRIELMLQEIGVAHFQQEPD
jgi:hypothetical protein